jgi:hypothetical protein
MTRIDDAQRPAATNELTRASRKHTLARTTLPASPPNRHPPTLSDESRLTAQAADSSGNVGKSSSVSVTVQSPPPTMTCFVQQAEVSVHGKGTVTTPSFHTAMAGRTLLAFVASDGPAGAGKQTATVSGGGFAWTVVKRANTQSGDSEVWTATAPSVLSSATVTSTLAKAGYVQDLTVVAYEGVDSVGASVAGSGASSAPNSS